jgi:hypothetical protein
MYNKRKKEETKQGKLFYKFLMNSVSGRFAMNQINIKYDIINIKDLKIKNIENITDIIDIENTNNLVLIKTLEDNMIYYYSNVQISAAITSYARCHLYNNIFDNKLDVYYIDTDSIVIKHKLPDNLISQTELGKYKLEYKIKKAIFPSIKTYYILYENELNIIKEIIKFKSLKKDFISHLNFNIFIKTLNR